MDQINDSANPTSYQDGHGPHDSTNLHQPSCSGDNAALAAASKDSVCILNRCNLLRYYYYFAWKKIAMLVEALPFLYFILEPLIM